MKLLKISAALLATISSFAQANVTTPKKLGDDFYTQYSSIIMTGRECTGKVATAERIAAKTFTYFFILELEALNSHLGRAYRNSSIVIDSFGRIASVVKVKDKSGEEFGSMTEWLPEDRATVQNPPWISRLAFGVIRFVGSGERFAIDLGNIGPFHLDGQVFHNTAESIAFTRLNGNSHAMRTAGPIITLPPVEAAVSAMAAAVAAPEEEAAAEAATAEAATAEAATAEAPVPRRIELVWDELIPMHRVDNADVISPIMLNSLLTASVKATTLKAEEYIKSLASAGVLEAAAAEDVSRRVGLMGASVAGVTNGGRK
jgi:hypothetical protein